MNSGDVEKASTEQLGRDTPNGWDMLLPENNGLGDFSDMVPEKSASSTAGLEVEPILIDSHVTRHAWDPGETDVLVCNVLDEYWLPDLDDSRLEKISIDERFKELRERTQFLDEFERYKREPKPEDDWKFKDIDKTIETFRQAYIEELEKQKQNPDNHAFDVSVNNTHNWLVTVRTYKYLLANPEQRRKEIEYDSAGLGQVLAERDERHGEAFGEVDNSAIQRRLNKILDKIPKRNFRDLAKLIGEDNKTNEAFEEKAFQIVSSALKIKRWPLRVENYIEDNSNTYGLCRNIGNGESIVRINQAKTSSALQLANTAAHETFHAKQHEIQFFKKGTKEADFYDYCFMYYVPPEFDYSKYVTQFTEAEAFYFGNEFSRRLEEAKAGLSDNLRTRLRRFLTKEK